MEAVFNKIEKEAVAYFKNERKQKDKEIKELKKQINMLGKNMPYGLSKEHQKNFYKQTEELRNKFQKKLRKLETAYADF